MRVQRHVGIRQMAMSTFDPTPLQMTTDAQLARLRKVIAEDAVRRCLLREVAQRTALGG